jgi:hypothetical protein
MTNPIAYIAFISHGGSELPILYGRPDIRVFQPVAPQDYPTRVLIQAGQLTSWIAYSHWGVSEAVKTAIEELEPGVHKFFPCKLFQSSVPEAQWQHFDLEAKDTDFKAEAEIKIGYYTLDGIPVVRDAIDQDASTGDWRTVKKIDGTPVKFWSPSLSGQSPICLYEAAIKNKHLFYADSYAVLCLSGALHKRLTELNALTGLISKPCRSTPAR